MIDVLRHFRGPWLAAFGAAIAAFVVAIVRASNGWDGGASPLWWIAAGTVLLAVSGWMLVRQLQQDLDD